MNVIQLLELLGDIYRRVFKAMEPLARSAGLSKTEMIVLWKIHAHGTCRVKELVSDLGLPPSTLTGILDRLTAAGWAAREADPDDRRAVVMRRTDTLEDFVRMLERERRKSLEAAFRKLPKDLVERLGADLTEVKQALEAGENNQ